MEQGKWIQVSKESLYCYQVKVAIHDYNAHILNLQYVTMTLFCACAFNRCINREYREDFLPLK